MRFFRCREKGELYSERKKSGGRSDCRETGTPARVDQRTPSESPGRRHSQAQRKTWDAAAAPHLFPSFFRNSPLSWVGRLITVLAGRLARQPRGFSPRHTPHQTREESNGRKKGKEASDKVPTRVARPPLHRSRGLSSAFDCLRVSFSLAPLVRQPM